MNKLSLQDCLSAVIDNRGVTPHKKGTEWCDNGIRVFSANNIKTNGIQKEDEIRCVPFEIYDSWMKIPFERGDLILTSEAPAGEVYYWDSEEKIILGQRLYGLKVKESINAKYLKYYLQSPLGQKAIACQQSGSTVFGISAKTFPNIAINLFCKSIQDKIGDCLYSIDSKIINNNKIISELESMAKTIYDYWFLQFDFPDENGKPYKASGGKMVWNEELKREIPEGWEAIELGKLFHIIMGSSPKGDTLNESKDGIEFYQGSTDFGKIFPTERVYTTGAIRYAKANDVLLSVRAPVGDMNIAMNDCCIGRGLSAIRHESSMFALNTLRTLESYFNIYNGSGTTFGALTSDALNEQLVVNLPDELILDYSKIVLPFEKMLRKCENENRKLASLRDFLLPMLMNGQVTFKDLK